jgi:hypothetical protein
MTDDQKPLLASSTMYLPIALKCAIVVAVFEFPIFLIEAIAAHFVLIGGWILILGYTLYRVWQLSAQSLLANEINFVKLVACIFLVGLTSAVMYVTVMTSLDPTTNNPTWQIKAAFISNPFVAFGVATFAMLATFVIEQVRAILDRLKR